jgi:hypothetical protein
MMGSIHPQSHGLRRSRSISRKCVLISLKRPSPKIIRNPPIAQAKVSCAVVPGGLEARMTKALPRPLVNGLSRWDRSPRMYLCLPIVNTCRDISAVDMD